MRKDMLIGATADVSIIKVKNDAKRFLHFKFKMKSDLALVGKLG